MLDASPGGLAREIATAIAARLDPETVTQANARIERSLLEAGVTFEGKTVRVSLFPTVFRASDVAELERRAGRVRDVLMRVIQQFRTEHHARRYDGPLHRGFAPYEPWWDAIADERRALPEIGLMRYDFISEAPGVWRMLETNTACPGGTTICASARDAWLTCGPIGDVGAAFDPIRFPVDDPTAFVRHLYATACRAAGTDQPNIAVLNDRASLTFEVDLWVRQHERLRRSGVVGGDFLVGDIRELEVADGRAWLRGAPVALIHNKVNPVEVLPSDPAVRGWLAASRTPGVELLNSLGAMYLTEAKRVMQLICAPEIQRLLEVSAEEAEAIDALIPPTSVIPARGAPGAEALLERLERDRETLVVKPDALTRGQGVYFGRTVAADQWRSCLDETQQLFGVAQRELRVPRAERADLSEDGVVRIAHEYFGADAYYFGDRFTGLSSRAHTQPVFNMGAGGALRPVLVIGRS